MGNQYPYRCTECGNVHPVDLVSEWKWTGGEYPPETIETIDGRAWDGCGRTTEHELVDQ